MILVFVKVLVAIKVSFVRTEAVMVVVMLAAVLLVVLALETTGIA